MILHLQVRVQGHDFIGYGEAGNKKAAQGLAAERFVNYLVENGLVNAAELPVNGSAADDGDEETVDIRAVGFSKSVAI